jgi:hypothetical protein
MAKTETLINDFKINYLTEPQYQAAFSNGEIKENELYLTPEASTKEATQKAAITTNTNYPVILASGTAATEITGILNKTSTLLYNPSTGALTTRKVVLSANYGNALPSSGVDGEIFLLLVE